MDEITCSWAIKRVEMRRRAFNAILGCQLQMGMCFREVNFYLQDSFDIKINKTS